MKTKFSREEWMTFLIGGTLGLAIFVIPVLGTIFLVLQVLALAYMIWEGARKPVRVRVVPVSPGPLHQDKI